MPIQTIFFNLNTLQKKRAISGSTECKHSVGDLWIPTYLYGF